ncbi:MAG: LysR family transcriptional regulator [Gordonia sp. (in: high G+C Gram-positive bacteria)]
MDEWMALLAPHLRALDELAAHGGHMTRAAAALRIPQSSMSRRIHALEKTLGVPLLVREGRAVMLTPAAVAIARQTRGALRELDDAVRRAVTEADPEHGTVRFGFPLTMGSGVIPDILAAFHRHHPGISLRLKQAHGQSLIADLAAGVLDLAVVIPPPPQALADGVDRVLVGTQDIVVVLPDDHPLAAHAIVPIAALREETFIANPASYHLRRLTEEVCARAGFDPAVAIEITEFASIVELVGRGLGVALLPAGMAFGATVERAMDRPVCRDIALVAGPTARTGASRALDEFLRQAIGNLGG